MKDGEEDRFAFDLSCEQFDEALSLANSHHVVMRCMETLRRSASACGNTEQSEWASAALEYERIRVNRAISFLEEIRLALACEGCEVIVIKSLDHWPDLGSDLDLYTDAAPADVIAILGKAFKAHLAARSWGDRLAHKWNFMIPGLPELVEFHMGRLGQTGELVNFANHLVGRARPSRIGDCFFQVPSAEDRLLIGTLQRMYRHFYIRLCDIADTVQLLEADFVNFTDLRDTAEECGIWDGVATFLTIAVEYTEQFGKSRVSLPSEVRSAARFGADQITFARGFLRVPILPHSLRLYASEWTALIAQGQLRSTARLSLLPWLATAAALGEKFTGSDKGIW